MRFNLDDYEPVEDRLRAFWVDHPTGRITTELLDHTDTVYIVAARVYRNHDESVSATGLAHEVVSVKGVNSTSALENCETSAIGRALANLGYAPKGKRPSREEMVKANTVTDTEWVLGIIARTNAAETRDDLVGLWEETKTGAAQRKCTPTEAADLLAAITERADTLPAEVTE